jgi:mannose-6-phosphate isomerase-like protein (cupin superfamily)
MPGILSLFFILMLTTSISRAQTPAQTWPAASGHASSAATFIPNAEIQAALRPADAGAVADTVLRVVTIGGEYNVGVSVVHRTKVNGKTPPDAIAHRAITEVYHVLEGNGILVTGGTIEGETELPPESPVVRTLVGPSTVGSAIAGGRRQRVGPGDVVIIPPNTPHGFSEITSDHITYLLVRVDPHRVLSAHD